MIDMSTGTTTPRLRSGEQIAIAHGPYSATIVTVGAVVRELTYAGRDLVMPFAADDVRPNYAGSVLVPWPNRIGRGQYAFQGHSHQLPLNEVERGNAMHGLVLWNEWNIVARADSSVSLATRVTARLGYPFDLRVTATYSLDDSGLNWRVDTHNVGDRDAPYGVGTHPYLTVGQGMADDWTITVPASRVLETTPNSKLPVELHDVAEFEDGRYDLRSPTRLAGRHLDHAFTEVARDSGNSRPPRSAVHLRGEGGTGVGVSWDPTVLPWVQVFTSDFPGTAQDRRGVAVECMTCPANSFNTGQGLLVLGPGTSHSAWWRIHGLDAA